MVLIYIYFFYFFLPFRRFCTWVTQNMRYGPFSPYLSYLQFLWNVYVHREAWFPSDRLESWTECTVRAAAACITYTLPLQQQTITAASSRKLFPGQWETDTEGQLSWVSNRRAAAFCWRRASRWPLKNSCCFRGKSAPAQRLVHVHYCHCAKNTGSHFRTWFSK